VRGLGIGTGTGSMITGGSLTLLSGPLGVIPLGDDDDGEAAALGLLPSLFAGFNPEVAIFITGSDVEGIIVVPPPFPCPPSPAGSVIDLDRSRLLGLCRNRGSFDAGGA
jgi:hypothetical protein